MIQYVTQKIVKMYVIVIYTFMKLRKCYRYFLKKRLTKNLNSLYYLSGTSWMPSSYLLLWFRSCGKYPMAPVKKI